MHVEVEEADLGVRHLRERLPVDAHELQQRDEREAGAQHRGEVAQQLEVVVGDPPHRVGVEAHREEEPLDQRGLEPGRRRPPRRACACAPAPGGSPRRSRRPGARSRSPRRMSSSEWPRSRRRATMRAWATAAGVQRPSRAFGTRPSCAQRPSVCAVTPARRAASVRDMTPSSFTSTPPSENQRRDLDDEGPAARGLNVPRRRPTALVHEGRHLAGGEPPTLRPFTLLGPGVINPGDDGCQRQTSRLKPSGAGTRSRRSRCSARRPAW